MSKTYVITRRAEGVRCTVHRADGVDYVLPHCGVHSPGKFEIGYRGSAPADLALAILADHCGALPMDMAAVTGKVSEPVTPQGRAAAQFAWNHKFDFEEHFLVTQQVPLNGRFEISTDVIEKWLERWQPVPA